MPLPEFNDTGDLPEGVHRTTFDDVIARLGVGTPRREEVTLRLRRIHDLAAASGGFDRLIIFGSYVTDKSEPNDVDVVLVMRDDFRLTSCPEASRVLFDHRRADDELGASVFWVRPAMLFGETIEAFIASWQRKREGGRRGIVEVVS